MTGAMTSLTIDLGGLRMAGVTTNAMTGVTIGARGPRMRRQR
jgi:hypothetical protein